MFFILAEIAGRKAAGRENKMLKIAFVEDSQEETERMREYCERYQKEFSTEIDLTVFPNGLQFLANYQPVYQLVFLDIEMPILNGMEAAKALYEMDKEAAIVFYTNMAKYAIKGYEVNALDFLVKPVSYATFRTKLKKWMPKLSDRRQKEFVLNLTGGNIVRLRVSDVRYIEGVKHYLIYHTVNGDYKARGTVADAEKQFREEGFSRSISGCLVNLSYVTGIGKDTVSLGSDALPLARLRKKEFMEEFMRYLRHAGGG